MNGRDLARLAEDDIPSFNVFRQVPQEEVNQHRRDLFTFYVGFAYIDDRFLDPFHCEYTGRTDGDFGFAPVWQKLSRLELAWQGAQIEKNVKIGSEGKERVDWEGGPTEDFRSVVDDAERVEDLRHAVVGEHG